MYLQLIQRFVTVTRPPFSLTDDEARQLITELAGIGARCPFSQRDHRPFVREFVRAMHRITGKTFSPAIYRRLLAAYAPERKPSTATLALEKERFAKELDLTPAAINADLNAGSAAQGGNLVAEIRQALEDMAGYRASARASHADSYLQAQCDFLQQRLSHNEKQLSEAKDCAHQIEAQRQVLAAQALRDREQIDSLRTAGAAMTAELARLAAAIDDARQFALLAIDEARGETRAWKERCIAAEAQYKGQVSLTETFRRLAYRQGADIPPALERKTT
jgi:prefoldin subunit 5